MASVVSVSIQSNLSEFPTEKRYDTSIKVSELKEKLELITGANHKTMKVSLRIDDLELGQLDNDDETLGHYIGEHSGKETTFILTVKDDESSPILTGDIPKYTISEDKYLERKNNARDYIKELREKRLSDH